MELSEASLNCVGETKQSNLSMRHKEKRRTESLNKAFADLRKCIPHVPRDTKLSKIKTLQLASNYIAHLSAVLQNPDTSDQNGELPEIDFTFKPCLSRQRKSAVNLQMKNKVLPSNLQRFGSEPEYTSGTIKRSKLKRAKGRTGWPETVWVEALASGSKSSDMMPSSFEEETFDSALLPFRSTSAPFPSENSVKGNVEIFVDVAHGNQPYFESSPMFMLGNEADYGYIKNSYFPCVDQMIPTPPDSYSDSQSNQDVLSFNPGSMNGCSTPPDLIHASAISLPLVPPVEPLPSITTLGSRYKDRYQTDFYAEITNTDFGAISPDFIDYDFQNGHNEEPSFAELQPVSQFSRKCAEIA